MLFAPVVDVSTIVEDLCIAVNLGRRGEIKASSCWLGVWGEIRALVAAGGKNAK